jgi:hypothetical protein
MFSFFIVSAVGLFLCVSPSINGAPPEIPQVKIISNLAIGILFASAAFSSFAPGRSISLSSRPVLL